MDSAERETTISDDDGDNVTVRCDLVSGDAFIRTGGEDGVSVRLDDAALELLKDALYDVGATRERLRETIDLPDNP